MTRILLLCLALAACNEAAEPARLDHAQILAVRATPPHAPADGKVKIDLLVGDYAGMVFETQPDTVIAGTLTVEHSTEGWFVTGGGVPAVTVAVSSTIDGETWRAEKTVVFDDKPLDNPSVTAVDMDGTQTAAVDTSIGARPALTANCAGGDTLTYAWYSSVGDLEHYHKQTATLKADAAADGTVAIVVRDDQGGVGWQVLPGHVQ